MAQNKAFTSNPIALTTTTTTNLLNCAITSVAGTTGFTATQPYLIIRHIRFVNKSASAATFTLYLGATGANTAGTEVIGVGYSVAANSAYDWYGMMRMNSTDYLVGGASANTALVMIAEGEIGFS